MNAFGKGLLVGAAVTVLVGGVAATFALKYAWDTARVLSEAAGAEKAEAVDTRGFSIQGLTRLVLAGGHGGVMVMPGDVNEIQLVAKREARGGTLEEATRRLEDVRWSARTEDGTLLIQQEAPEKGADLKEHVRRMGQAVHFTVTLPRGAKLPLDVRTGAGSVSLTGLSAPATVETGVGTITASGMGPLTLRAGTGEIQVADGKGELKAETGVGDIGVTRHAGPATLETGTGDIRLALAPGADVRIETHRGVGDMENGLGASREPGGDEEEAVWVLGKGTHRITASTGVGDIRLVPAP